MRVHLLIDFSVPALYVLKRLPVCDVVDDHDAIGISVVAVCYGSKTILTGSVPLNYRLAVQSAA